MDKTKTLGQGDKESNFILKSKIWVNILNINIYSRHTAGSLILTLALFILRCSWYAVVDVNWPAIFLGLCSYQHGNVVITLELSSSHVHVCLQLVMSSTPSTTANSNYKNVQRRKSSSLILYKRKINCVHNYISRLFTVSIQCSDCLHTVLTKFPTLSLWKKGVNVHSIFTTFF